MNAQEPVYRNAQFARFEPIAKLRPPTVATRTLRPDRLAAHQSLARLPMTQISSMKTNTATKNSSTGLLAKGQLWKVDDAYLQIVELGKRLIHYKLMKKPEQKAVLTRMIGIEALAHYLRNNEATLVN